VDDRIHLSLLPDIPRRRLNTPYQRRKRALPFEGAPAFLLGLVGWVWSRAPNNPHRSCRDDAGAEVNPLRCASSCHGTVSGTVLTLRLPVHHALYPGCPFGLIQRGAKIKAGKKSAPCAASPRKSSKLAPSLRSVAQTAKIFVRSDPAPVEPPISSRPVVSGPVGGAERTRHSTAWIRMDVLRLT
jgi:hypothetical protein